MGVVGDVMWHGLEGIEGGEEAGQGVAEGRFLRMCRVGSKRQTVSAGLSRMDVHMTLEVLQLTPA